MTIHQRSSHDTSSPPHGNPDICIIGAGPVGAALACALGTHGLHVAIIDKSPLSSMEDPALDGRAYAISAGPQEYLNHYGIWQDLPQIACPIENIYVTDDRLNAHAQKDCLKLDHRVVDRPFGWMTRARSLRVALNRALKKTPNVSIFSPSMAKITYEQDCADVELTSGEKFSTQLIIAADGRNSFLRRQAHIPVTKIPYHQTAIVGVMAHEFPHNNGALEHFLPHGPFAQLPLPGNEKYPHISAFVWSETPQNASRFNDMSDLLFSKQLMARMEERGLGNVKVLNPRWTYPLSAQYASRYYAHRMILVGDAAHGVHPIAGQGLNLGYRDIRILTQILTKAHQQKLDLGDKAIALQYQRLCRPANMMMLAATDTLDKIFSSNNPLLRKLRDAGLSVFSNMPNLRKKFVEYAMGI